MVHAIVSELPCTVAGGSSTWALANMSDGTQWTWSDGWILMATYLAQGSSGAKLNEVIGAADAINHAIPTAKELSHAFTDLARNGVIRCVDDRIKISGNHLQGIESAYQGKGGLFDSAQKGKKWLLSMSFTLESTRAVELTEDEVSAAYAEYTAKLRRRNG